MPQADGHKFGLGSQQMGNDFMAALHFGILQVGGIPAWPHQHQVKPRQKWCHIGGQICPTAQSGLPAQTIKHML
jgi:hypothetical protein